MRSTNVVIEKQTNKPHYVVVVNEDDKVRNGKVVNEEHIIELSDHALRLIRSTIRFELMRLAAKRPEGRTMSMREIDLVAVLTTLPKIARKKRNTRAIKKVNGEKPTSKR